MKTEEEFLNDIYEKAELLREKESREAAIRKKHRKAAASITAAAACIMLVAGASGIFDHFAVSDGVLESESAFTYENASGSSEPWQMNDGQTGDSAADDAAAADMERQSVYDGASDPASGASPYAADKNAEIAGNPNSTSAANPQGSSSDDSSAAPEKSRSIKEETEEKASNDSGDSDAYDAYDAVSSYYCLPAKIIIEYADGNAEAATGNAITAVFDEVMKLESEGKAVSAKLGEPAPVEAYVKRVIYVTNGTASSEGEIVRLDDEHPDNIVWYITE